jgi:hypothetical protein
VAYDADLFRKEGNKVSVAYTGSEMPPRKALDGTYVAPNGSRIRVPPLTDEDRRTIVRWIDLGCPIDLAGVKVVPPGEDAISNDGGWFDDENRPTVSVVVLSSPGDGAVERIAVGLYDGESGLDLAGLRITADVELNGVAAGRNLASLFRETDSVWTLDKPRLGGAQVVRGVVRAAGGDEARAVDASTGSRGSLTVRVRDRAGNETVRTREIAPRR